METLQQSKSAFSVLVVEDDRTALDALCLMIKIKLPDFTVYTAQDGRSGIDVFRKHTPDVIVTDVNMPVMNGMEMAEEIKSIKPDTKFIVLTAYNEKVFFEKFKKIGCSAFIVKPVEFRKLIAAIERCVAELC